MRAGSDRFVSHYAERIALLQEVIDFMSTSDNPPRDGRRAQAERNDLQVHRPLPR